MTANMNYLQHQHKPILI